MKTRTKASGSHVSKDTTCNWLNCIYQCVAPMKYIYILHFQQILKRSDKWLYGVMMSSMDASYVGVNISNCTNVTLQRNWENSMYKLYTCFYLFIFIPGLLGNSLALWVLCRLIRSVFLKLHLLLQEYIKDLLCKLLYEPTIYLMTVTLCRLPKNILTHDVW